MRTPFTLIIPAGVFGVVVPLAFLSFAAATGKGSVAGVLALGSLAVVPMVATVIAFRQGYDHGLADRQRRECQESDSRRT